VKGARFRAISAQRKSWFAITDDQDRRRLCGLPSDRIESLFAVSSGTYRAVCANVGAGGDTREEQPFQKKILVIEHKNPQPGCAV
jgi:hypothetical protein